MPFITCDYPCCFAYCNADFWANCYGALMFFDADDKIVRTHKFIYLVGITNN